MFSLRNKKVKNISKTSMGDKMGRLHMQRQDLDKITGKKMAVLRDRNPKPKKGNEDNK